MRSDVGGAEPMRVITPLSVLRDGDSRPPKIGTDLHCCYSSNRVLGFMFTLFYSILRISWLPASGFWLLASDVLGVAIPGGLSFVVWGGRPPI